MKNSIFLILAVLSLTTASILYAQGQKGIIGGPCEYDNIQGTAEIISVAKTSESIGQAARSAGPGYEGYEIQFRFKPSDPEQKYDKNWEDRVEKILAGKHDLQLTNSWYPGKKFLKKYNIKKGKTFKCTMRLITKGTCTPIVFEFPDIDKSDYFESGR